jgi:hypothetical protein
MKQQSVDTSTLPALLVLYELSMGGRRATSNYSAAVYIHHLGAFNPFSFSASRIIFHSRTLPSSPLAELGLGTVVVARL